MSTENSDQTKERHHDMYPLPIPRPPPEGSPLPSIGINKRADTEWNPSASHLMSFSDKDDTYGKPPEGMYVLVSIAQIRTTLFMTPFE